MKASNLGHLSVLFTNKITRYTEGEFNIKERNYILDIKNAIGLEKFGNKYAKQFLEAVRYIGEECHNECDIRSGVSYVELKKLIDF